MSGERDDEKTWAELVDAFNADPEPRDGVTRWPAAENVEQDDLPDQHEDDPYGEMPDPYARTPRIPGNLPHEETPEGGRVAASSADGTAEPYTSEDDHFVPPNPPPIPRGDRATRWAWTGMAGAPSVLLLSSVLNWTPSNEVMLVLVGGFVAGFVTLIGRMRGRNPHDPDNGAVV
ncbi:hypothetical protein [Phytoactinopolyspora mesophila]|uniref:DUF308 domain-containing protein n=1 Tax=Phytoactinopolyspora mesophila TaxID=2650750 RepID=A0A7K3M1Y5_9ACTN|nr:hypothetical protein [Phytoactinopolyspora mesophila]NDL57303.1 hypothetical protein [Phytoactinopolyspora mesophila]